MSKRTRFKTTGQLLAEDMRRNGWTQVDFAEHVGISKETLNRLIHEKQGITPERALMLSNATGRSPTEYVIADAITKWHQYQERLLRSSERKGGDRERK